MGSARRMAVVVVAASLAAGAVPSASAGTIFFTKSTRGQQSGELWAVGANGASPRLLRGSMPIGPEGATATLSADDRGIVCLCRPGEVDLLDRDGSNLRRIGSRPRGTRYDIVTLSARGGAFWVKGNSRIFSQKAGGKPRVLRRVRGAAVDERVVPNPAGTRIAFVQYGCLGPVCLPGEAIRVRTVGVDGGSPRTVFASSQGDREIADLEWSRDGRRLIFSSSTEFEKESTRPFESEFLVVGSDGSGPEALPLSPTAFSYPFFSPDGTRLAVSGRSRSGYEQLLTVGLDGGGQRPAFRGSCRWPACEFPPRPIGWTP